MRKAVIVGLAGLLCMSSQAGVKHFYSFVDGDFKVDQISGADGTLYGNAALSSGALTMDGTSSDWESGAAGPTHGMALPASVAEDIGTGPFTFSYWIELSATAGYAAEFALSDTTTSNWILGTPFAGNHDSASYVRVQGSGATYAATYDYMEVAGPPQSAAVLYHKVFVYDGSEARLYIDGVQPSGFSYPPTADISGLNLGSVPNFSLMGGSPWGDPAANGTMYSFAVFDEALDANEVAALYAAGEVATVQDLRVAIGDLVLQPKLFIVK